jgi:hypothetical protein
VVLVKWADKILSFLFSLGWWGLLYVLLVIDGLVDFYACEIRWIIWDWSRFGCCPD